jgi:MFS family permease
VLGDDNPQCLVPAVQKNVAIFTLVISIVTGILSALTAPRLGSLSDRYGRKRLMAICSMGGIVSEVIIILAAKYPDSIHYNWLILGAVFDGLAGSFTAGSALSHSYTSDCTPPSRRGVAYGYMHACLFFGLAFGPLLAAFLVEQFGSLLSIFYITLGCHIFFILFVIFVLPESLSKRRQMMAREKYEIEKVPTTLPPSVARALSYLPFEGTLTEVVALYKANPFAPLKILWPKGESNGKLRRNLLTLSLIDMGILGAAMSSGTVTILYIQSMFNWHTAESSKYLSFMSLIRVFMLLAILPLINYVFRIRPAKKKSKLTGMPIVESNNGADKLDIWILRTAIISDIIGVAGYIFVRTPALFIGCGVITAFGGLGSATIQAAITKHVPAERVGQLLGAIGQLHAFSRILSPLIFNGLYAATVETFPQAFFVLLTCLFAVALVASFGVRPHGMS